MEARKIKDAAGCIIYGLEEESRLPEAIRKVRKDKGTIYATCVRSINMLKQLQWRSFNMPEDEHLARIADNLAVLCREMETAVRKASLYNGE